MAHQQLWSFSVHVIVLKDNKSGISMLKNFNISIVVKSITRIISDLTIQNRHY